MRKFEESQIARKRLSEGRRRVTSRKIWVGAFTATLVAVVFQTVLTTSHSTAFSTPITNWSATTSLPEAIAGVNAVTHDENTDGNDDYIYLIGGRKASGEPSSAVFAGRIHANGSIAEWKSTASLPQPLYLHSVSTTDSFLYVIGGWKGSDPMQATVYRAQFLGGGELSAWQVEGIYPTKINQHRTVIAGNRIYGIGGFNGDPNSSGINNVYFATIGFDGSLSAWQATTSFPFAIRRHAAVLSNNNIYVSGGIDASNSAVQRVYVATIQNDGTLGSWSIASTMPEPIFYHQSTIHDGELLVMGGKSVNNGPDSNAVFASAIGTDGSLGPWRALPSMPKGLFRFAATSVGRWGSQYLLTLGGGQGLNSSPSVLTDVYTSDVPPTPTPTPTATATPTPTPPVSISIQVENTPSHWIAPNEEVTYVINYRNIGSASASNPIMHATIPEHTEFVSGSSSPPESSLTSTSSGGTIRWNIDALEPNESGTISYRVRRVNATSNQPPSALSIALEGPSAAASGEPINYTLTITNQAIQLDDAVVMVHVPEEATYVGSDSGAFANGVITWETPTFPVATLTLNFTLRSSLTFVIHDYKVEAQVPPPGGPATTRGIGKSIVVTTIDGLPPTGDGDGITIVNDDIRISWDHNGTPGTFVASGVSNPRPLLEKVFLPLTQ